MVVKWWKPLAKLSQPQLLVLQNEDLVPRQEFREMLLSRSCKGLEETEEEEEMGSYKERRRVEWRHHEIQVARRTAPSHNTALKRTPVAKVDIPLKESYCPHFTCGILLLTFLGFFSQPWKLDKEK